jgi:osmotically inducible protein OsmC
MSILYTANVNTTGGREGSSSSDDEKLKVKLSTPKELGGAGGDGTNPEQLFAAGYSSCFLSAMKFVATKDKITLPQDTSISAIVGIKQVETGFALEVELKIKAPSLDREVVQTIVDKAHIVCPYSNATRNNVNVKLTLI